MPEFHIAQINIARMLAPITDPVMQDFVAQLLPINALADESPGFVWRLQSESGDATSIKVYEDDMIIINLTVWESIDALREFAYKSAHSGVLTSTQYRGRQRTAGLLASAWRFNLCVLVQECISCACGVILCFLCNTLDDVAKVWKNLLDSHTFK